MRGSREYKGRRAFTRTPPPLPRQPKIVSRVVISSCGGKTYSIGGLLFLVTLLVSGGLGLVGLALLLRQTLPLLAENLANLA